MAERRALPKFGVVLVVLTVLVVAPAPVVGQLGDMRCEIAVASNPEKTVTFVTIDILNDAGEPDSGVDHVFVIVKPSEALNEQPAKGRIRMAGLLTQSMNPFLEVLLTDTRSLFFVAPGDPEPQPQGIVQGLCELRASYTSKPPPEGRTSKRRPT